MARLSSIDLTGPANVRYKLLNFTFSQATIAWQAEKTGDYYGDGNSDILWRNTDGSTFIWLMNGTREVGSGFTTPQNSTEWSIF